MRFFTKICIGMFAFIFISMTLISCNPKEKKVEPVIRPVKTMTIENNTAKVSRNFPGKVLASNRVDLSFDVPGQLIEFPVLAGDHVQKGQLIAKLDPQK